MWILFSYCPLPVAVLINIQISVLFRKGIIDFYETVTLLCRFDVTVFYR